ncbi:MAG: amidohydrolase family protein [Gemmatimonadetes bacterium]|nr:amidohydrolase family protein [Gemmatimonadota bacterium]
MIENVTLIGSPGAEPHAGTTLVIDGGRFSRLLDAADPSPPAALTLDAEGSFATAGFWNGHVHFTEPVWGDAASADPDDLRDALDAMLNRYGFTSALDTGSDIENTLALRDRIDAGELAGPRIRTAGGGLVPPGGSPAYLEVSLPELDTPEAAEDAVERVLDAGGDAVKLFTGSFVGPGRTAEMTVEVASAAVATAKRRGARVVAHPQSERGVRTALEAGVDVLAHTAPNGGPWSGALVSELVAAEIGLSPTLKLWRYELGRFGVPEDVIENVQAAARQQVGAFVAAGGALIFGTDVGYMTDYDPIDEYALLREAGIGFDEILRALTTTPERYYGDPASGGTVEEGKRADLVILRADPRVEIESLARPKWVVASGRIAHGL